MDDWQPYPFSWPVMTRRNVRGFTVIELMVAVAVLALLTLVLLSMTEKAGSIWVNGVGQMEKRRNARALLEYISSDLRSALVPLSQDITKTSSNLQFVLNPPAAGLSPDILNASAIFWQAPISNNQQFGEIAEVGYFVRFDPVPDSAPLRLCRFYVTAGAPDPSAPGDLNRGIANSDFKIYHPTDRYAWLEGALLDRNTHARPPEYTGLFADNVLGFWARCLDPEGNEITRTAEYVANNGSPMTSGEYPAGSYDSTKGYRYTRRDGQVIDVPPPALPPVVEISVVVTDSRSASRLKADEVELIRNSQHLVQSPTDLPAFVNNLPPSVRGSARATTLKVKLSGAL